MQSQWTDCSASCGGGVSLQEFDCVCDGNSIDSSDEACTESRPATVSLECNIKPCPACSFIELVAGSGAPTNVAKFVGWYKLARDKDGTPAVLNEYNYYQHDGIKHLFMYSIEAYERKWWVISPTLGSTYNWLSFIEADVSSPTLSTVAWKSASVLKRIVSEGANIAAVAVPTIVQHCMCDDSWLTLDATEKRCVQLLDNSASDKLNQGAFFGGGAGERWGDHINPESSSTPAPEDFFDETTPTSLPTTSAAAVNGTGIAVSSVSATGAPRCPIYYAPDIESDSIGCVRQYMCSDGVMNLNSKKTCSCKEEDCKVCMLAADGELRCLLWQAKLNRTL
jgi:hypothetical protein